MVDKSQIKQIFHQSSELLVMSVLVFQEPREPRLQVLCDTLGVTNTISTSIAAKFQLPVYVTCYWLSKADPQPHIEHLWSLLLGFVFGELSGRYKGQEGDA